MDYTVFKQIVGNLCGVDLSQYKSQQMDRRIKSLMESRGIASYEEYLGLLKKNPVCFKEFVDRLTINVSEFFRNPQRFEELQDKYLPELLSRNYRILVWSAGCSNGSEPYSISLIAHELQASKRIHILATDIDAEILHKAGEGVYNANDVKSLSPLLLNKYFTCEDGTYYLVPEIKETIEFKRHNLLKDDYPGQLDLILCRNVVIYFTEEAKNNMYHRFFASLKPGGYLLVGGTEPILNYREIGFEYVSTSFYQKPL